MPASPAVPAFPDASVAPVAPAAPAALPADPADRLDVPVGPTGPADDLVARANKLVNSAAALVASSSAALTKSVSAVAMSASLVVRSAEAEAEAEAAARAAMALTPQAPPAAVPALGAPASDVPGGAVPAAAASAVSVQAPPATVATPAGAAQPVTVRAPVTVNGVGSDVTAAAAPAARVEGGPDGPPAQVSGGVAVNRAATADTAARPTAQPTPLSDPEDPPAPRPNAGEPNPTPVDPCHPDQSAGFATSAAAKYGWGKPNRVEEFDGPLDKSWGLYDGPGHGGKGRRTPDAVSLENGVMTITGDPNGNTEGMAWDHGQKYGRWEGRVKAPASDRSYNALLLLWPDAENWPVGGEVDFMEMSDHTRQSTDMFLHYGHDNSQLQGNVKIDATQWHNWAVEWTPDHIAAFVDGKQWWRTDNTKALPPGPMHLCIQLDWFPHGGVVQTSHMYVDWVRQYPLNPGDTSAGKPDDGSSSEGTTTSTKPGLVHVAVAVP